MNMGRRAQAVPLLPQARWSDTGRPTHTNAHASCAGSGTNHHAHGAPSKKAPARTRGPGVRPKEDDLKGLAAHPSY